VAVETLRRWWPTGLLVVLGALAGLGYALVRQPVYAANAYVVVVAQNSGDNTAVSYAQAYARIAGQGDGLVAAVRDSNGQVSADDLRRTVRASSSPDAPVIEVTGSAYPATRAADLANLVANALISTANQHSTDTRVRLVLLGPAMPPTSPASPQPAIDIAVGAAAGLLLGGLALLSRSSRRPATGRRADVPAGDGAGPWEDAGVSKAQRWIGTAPAFPPPVPVTGNTNERQISNGRGMSDDDDSTGDDDSEKHNDPGGHRGLQRKQSQRVARRNNVRRRRPR
jgi:capsular polysaccharide biosynthesis protein